jgi:hypothetical protein
VRVFEKSSLSGGDFFVLHEGYRGELTRYIKNREDIGMAEPELSLEILKQKLKNLGLSDWGRHHLGWALGDFFGRPIESK